MHFILNILFLPLRLIQYLYYILWVPFRSGKAIYIKIPKKFSNYKKTSLVELITGKDSSPLLLDFLYDLELVSKSKRIDKVFFTAGEMDFGLAELSNICSAIEKIKANGIKTIGFAEEGGLKTLYLLSYMEERYSTQSSEFMVLLPALESFFFGGFLKKIGIEVEGFASGPYKSLAEQFNRTGFSKPAKENIQSLLSSIRKQIAEVFLKNASLKEEDLYTPIIPATNLKEIGFLQGFIDGEDFEKNYYYKNFTGETTDLDSKPGSISHVHFFENKKNFSLFPEKLTKIIVLPLKGNISMGKEEEEFKSDAINAYPVIAALREIAEDSKIKGLILEIDSGGGSAFASELIYKEILKLKKKNIQIVAYQQNVSASGGYYIACACDKIVSNPYCITGSIGTVMVRPDLKKLYTKLGITKERIEFYPLRDIFSEYGKVSPESKKYLKSEIDRVNHQFYDRVIASRKISEEELTKLAEGRVFSGKDFFDYKMADSNGTLMETISFLKETINKKRIEIIYEPGVYSIRSMVKEFRFGLSILTDPLKILNDAIYNSENYFKSSIGEMIAGIFRKM